jgi:hypothetical protein
VLAAGAVKTERQYAELVVDGRPLHEVLGYEGENISSLGWGPVALRQVAVKRLLLEEPADFPNSRYALLICPECGDLGCGAVSAAIRREGETVVWSDFGIENDYQDSIDRSALTPPAELRFRWSQYTESIRGAINA